MAKLSKFIPKIVRGFVQCACVTYCAYEYVGDIIMCAGPSMEPTLYANDILFVERISVRLQRLNKGDIVISKCPYNPKENICKRIVGLPGDKIRNGLSVTTVPYGHMWLEGDNSSNSTDSRIYGPVPQGLLRGRALCKIFPFGDITLFTTKHMT
ncbi:mitochondrial inner membrane protease subunit 1-like [Odontomachus brunneus]|uniref:mitochondrial inner membrane protease subunit 1-like n=1 Tax=Odontomachus brunneus TaxID=486640 RepID=UPI0013F28A6C|nr:mitochondrial inner membrane protease subunit 1-like [Odontomachus brunneus]XP_032677290.1 mitochondrial inner membrane protease subunit 1-like [Odontomachus brunneus]XP_032677291.1 mitochondrial inner membrane protease subunit 1-like [Odontomachus brunneus]